MNILIISYEMIPYTNNWGGCQRVHYLANELAKEHNVTVVSSQNTKIASKKVDKPQNYETVFMDNSLHVKLFDRAAPVSAVGNSGGKRKLRPSLLTGINDLLNTIFFNEPAKCGAIVSLWVWRHAKDILKSIESRNIDIVIISMPPWSVASLSMVRNIKRMGIKLIIDYRDPWNCWNDKKGFSLWKERKLLEYADRITVTNSNHKERLIQDYALPENIVSVIMNGYDAELWNTIEEYNYKPAGDILTLTFIGSISFSKDKGAMRNPYNLVQAISELPFKEKLKLKIVGNYNEDVVKEVRSIIPHFEMIPFVPQRDSFIEMCKSDVLINLHVVEDGSSRYLIAGKIFDYYRSRTFILSINDTKSFEKKFIEENQIGIFSTNKVEELKNTLTTIYDKWCNNSFNLKLNCEVPKRYSRQYQNTLYADLIKNI